MDLRVEGGGGGGGWGVGGLVGGGAHTQEPIKFDGLLTH